MRKKALLLSITAFLTFVPGVSRAELSELGSFSANDIDRITEALSFRVDGSDYALSSQDLLSAVAETDSLAYSAGYSSEIENTDFCLYKKSFLCALSFPVSREGSIRKLTVAAIDQDALGSLVSELAQKTDKNAENAKFKLEDGKVSSFSTGSAGLKIRQDEAVRKIAEALEKRAAGETVSDPIELAFDRMDPDVPIQSVDSMGIDTLIGEGRSNFRGSTRNRIANIKVAIQRFDGILIKPGEEFSFVKALGDVDEEHGYYPELVIKKDKTEAEFGGGVCQVSTTAFRAAVYSGLEVTARRNHAYPVSYYNPQGMDSTVYIPKPDLRFVNDTPGYILIQVRIEGTELIFDFYGTDDGRKVNVIGPKVIEKNADGSMKTTFTQQVIDKDGNVVREDVFNSSYDSPNKYPHPSTTESLLSSKPKDWSERQWKQYKKDHDLQ